MSKPTNLDDVRRLEQEANQKRRGKPETYRDARYAFLASQASWLDEQIEQGKTVAQALQEYRGRER